MTNNSTDNDINGIFSIILLIIYFYILYFAYSGYYKYNLYKHPCTEVYNGKELIYKGNSYHYQTKSIGTKTIYKEYEKTYFFPKIIKEITFNNLTIKTISCPSKKEGD